MLKKLTGMFVLLAFLLGVFAAPALAGHRLEDNNGGEVSLDAVSNENVPEQANALAKFKLDPQPDGVSKMDVNIEVDSLPKRAGRVYEVWLLDEDGDDLNLTAFNTDTKGNATTDVTRNIVNIAPFERIVVSTKRSGSFDTDRGTTVLSGSLQ